MIYSMYNPNTKLTREILEVKRQIFPELRFVRVKGIYVGENFGEDQGNGWFYHSMISVYNPLSDHIDRICILGWTTLFMPANFSGKYATDTRRGLIARSLSEMIIDPLKEKDEFEIDRVVIERGFGRPLTEAVKNLEVRGHERPFTYSSRELGLIVTGFD